ncbi:MAG: DUF3990 domain-containing protein [Prevotellaceae bacterium]|jgi:hypothetical protein|nr:DUF3990 domain-containing protein [Prevotellaceae bacterium]
MKVYHGSYTEIDKIDIEKCRLYRDFGRGFYVTKILEQAEIWANRKGKERKTKGVVTEFEFIESAFEHWEFLVKRFNGYTEEWLDFIVMNRSERIPQPSHDFDIVEGPVADDDVAERIDDYIRGNISKEQFLEELKFKKPTHQICLCSHRSFQAIQNDKKNEIAYKLKEITKPIIMHLISEQCLGKADAADKLYNSETFAQLADKTTKLYEKDWSEVYKLLLKELSIK